MISLQHVSKQYDTKKHSIKAVDDVSLTVDDCDIFGIIGFSGAGKSTLVRLINGLESVSEGKVIVDGNDITTLKKKDLLNERKKIAMIFQHFNLLWSRTVAENIEFPLEIANVPKAKRKERVKELIRLVSLEGHEDYYPAQLSGGQKQRVGIARALANEPKLLLCDEATSALDPKTTDDILDLLVKINKELGLTIVIITHEMHVVSKICHHVAVMEDGKIVEEGSVVDVFRNPQQPITKQFIGDEQETVPLDDLLETLSDELSTGYVIRLHYTGASVLESRLTSTSKELDIPISILQAKMNITQAGSVGSMVVHAACTPEQLEQLKKKFDVPSINLEVIANVE